MVHIRVPIARLLVAAWAMLLAVPVAAQTQTAPSSGSEGTDPMEVVRLKTGRVLRGLIESRTKTHLDFIEFFRPQGKPMFAVVRRIELREIDDLRSLPEDQRGALVRQADRFRNRARIEQGRMESLSLGKSQVNGTTYWNYRGGDEGRSFFTLRSTMDEEMTRRAIVRIEQIFTAYRRLMPPRARPRRLEIVLFGSMREYREFLGRKDLDLNNPAFYSTRRNLIAAGSQLEGLHDALQQAQAKQASILREIERIKDELPATLRLLNEKLAGQGVEEELRKQITNERRQRIETAAERLRRQAQANERRNAAKFDLLTARMFTRLYHEAFHAYLENFVYPAGQHDVPRWLNEGMAQVFEQGQLEDGLLRIDAPNRDALTQLQKLLRSERTTSLAEVLRAKQSAFLVTHTSGGGSRRYYLVSWGLAHYLTFDRPLLSREAMDGYTSPAAAKMPPVARFERLIGTSLEQFEQDWRKAMLAIPPSR